MAGWWENHDWRFIQTNLREIDMADIDARRYVADLLEFGATVAMINAAGIIASYPTKLQYHTQSPYLTGDSLKDILAACHKAGIRVMARTDFSKVRRPVYEANPGWAYRTPEGKIIDYNGDVHVCINGGYQQEYALEIIRECVTTHDFDGIFFNMGGYQTRDYSGVYHGICHCHNCRRRFLAETGLALPAREDMADPAYRAYRLFQARTTAEYNERVCRFIKSIRPDMLINHDVWTEPTGMIRQESNTALDRALPHWQYSGSENTKWVRGSFPGMISSNCTVDFIDFPARHAAISPVQQETRLYQNLANGGMVDYYIIGRLDNKPDRSGYAGVKRAFAFHKANEALYRNPRSCAEIALLTHDHWGGGGDVQEAYGLYRMLTEGHFLFDVVFLSRLDAVDLGKYKALVVPDLRRMTDTQAAAIDAFVAKGGKALITGQSGFQEADGSVRAVPALRCMGIADAGVTQDVRGAYFTISKVERGDFPRLADMDLMYVDGLYTYARFADGESRMRLLPPQPFGPPELCYPVVGETAYPAVVSRAVGRGLAAMMPWNPGRLFLRQGYGSTAGFVQDVLEGIVGVKPVETNLPPMVEVTMLTDAAGSYRILHMVNQSGHFGNSFYAPVEIADVVCRVACDGPRVVESLVDHRAVAAEYEGGMLTVRLERLGMFEALWIREG